MAKNRRQNVRPWWRPQLKSSPRAAHARPLLAEQLEPRVLFSAGPTAPPESSPEPDTDAAVQVQEADAPIPLTQEALAPLIVEATERWRGAGLSEEEISELNDVVYELADLEGYQLAVAQDKTIILDETAAGLGWFVDTTPAGDEEFSGGIASDGAQNRIDLLTALMHEQAHVLGIHHDEGQSSGILSGQLATGERRQVTAEIVSGEREDSHGEPHYLSALAIDGLSITSQIDEGGTVIVSGRVSDDSVGATFQLIVNWDASAGTEGGSQSFTLSSDDIGGVDGMTWNADTRDFFLEHVYLDDNPTATPSDTYNVSVRLEREADPGGVIPIGQQLAKITSNTAAANDEFGSSVAISGNFAAVGVPLDENPGAQDSGSVIIYERQIDQSWVEVQRITAKFTTGFVQDDFEFGDWFGGSVALDGNLLVVGAVHSDVDINTRNEGAAYVYERNTTTGEWEFRDRLLQAESDVNIAGFFGSSVAIEGDTIVVGALGREVGGGSIQAGAAYVFERATEFGWNEVAKVTASDPGHGHRFGESVAISGNRFVVGAPQNDTGSAYVFENSGAGWQQTEKLVASDGGGGDRYGISVDIEGDTIVVGARVHDLLFDEGAAYVYELEGGAWEETKLVHAPSADHPVGDQFGSAVTIDGGRIAISASQNDFQIGAAYFFEKDPANGWQQYAEVKAEDGAGGDQLGFMGSIAMDEGIVLIGSRFDDDDGDASGSAYFFAAEEIVPPATRTIEAGTQLQKVTSSTAALEDEFGADVAISGDFAAVGVPFDENSGAEDSGSVILFQRQEDETWVEIQRVTAQQNLAGTIQDDFEFGDWFGGSVAIDGNLLVVGAVHADTEINTRNEGAVYIYERDISSGTWEFREKLLQEESDVNIAGFFGSAVAVENETIVVGALGREVGGNVQAGAVYVFERVGDVWSETTKVTAPDPGNGFRFGESVAISGDRIVAGAPQNGAGAAYVFEKSGGVWSQTIKLESSDGAGGDRFGISVDVEGDTIIVGARTNDAVFDEGAAYVYELNGLVWEETKLTHTPGEDSPIGDQFGSAVAIDNGIIAVSASQNNFQAGAAYLFAKDPANGWEQFSEIKADDAAGGDQFGFIGGLALDNGIALIGSRFDDDDGTSSGSAYFFAAEDKVVLDDNVFEATLQTTVNNLAPELSEERGDSDFFDFVENGLANRSAHGNLTVTDPGTQDTHTGSVRSSLSVSGTRGGLSDEDFLAMLTVVETVADGKVEWSFNSGSETFDFLDEGDSLTLRYTIEVSDDDGSVDSRAVTIQVYGSEEAASPIIEDLTVTPVINEGGEVAVTGTVVDPNADDTFSLTIIWDAVDGTEGTGDSFALGDRARSKAVDGYDWDPATRMFSAYHVYLDDNPTDTPLDEYQLYVTLSDRAASGSQQWLQIGEDIDGDVGFDLSGHAVAMSSDGRTIAVASPLSDVAENNAGAVDVYFWSEGESRWEKRGESIPGNSAGEESGSSVAMSDDGNTLVIGASRNDDTFTNAGRARVYDWNAGSGQWEQRGDVIDGESGGALAGHAVALSGDGDTVVVGEFGDDQARVYAWDSGTEVWERKGSDLESVRSLERFGFSVDLSSDGDTVIVGSRENNPGEPGHVRIYDFVGGAWQQRGADVEGESISDQFGYSVALSSDGNTFIAGAIHNDDAGESAGNARVYDWDDTSSNWVQRGLDLDGDAEDDQFGSSVGVSADGNTVVIGAPFNNDNGSNAGLVRAYEWNETSRSWERKGYNLDGENSGDESGTAVAISADGETILIGAHGNNAGGSDAGHAKVYRWVDRLETTEVFEDYLTTTVVNVAPELLLGPGDSNAAELTETGAGNLSASGTASFGDVGVEDTVTILSGVTVETSGPRAGLSDDDFVDMFFFARPIGSLDISWGFNSGAETFAYLDLGETLEITYQIRAIDDDGGIGTGEFTIQVYGSQNAVAPVLSDLEASDTTEGVAPVLSGSFSDLNVGDTHTLTVNWGDPDNAIDSVFAIPAQGDLAADQEINADDGSVLTIVSVTQEVVAFFISGRAYRDDPADGLPDEFEATVRITDSSDQFDSSTVTAVVENTDPVFDSLTVTPSVEESGEVTVSGTIIDPGVLDEFVLAINWDGENDSEGAPQVITLGSADIVDVNGVSWDASTRIFSVAHTYADDNPTDTASDTYRVEVSLRDNDPEFGSDSLPLSTTTALTTVVNNVAPGFTLLPDDSLSAAFTENGSRLSTFDTVTRTDPGSLDTHTPSVGDVVAVTGDAGDLTQADLLSMFEFDFTDGDPETFFWEFDSGSETFEHLGQDEILILEYEIRLTDDDGGIASETVTITITGFEEEVAPYGLLISDGGAALFSPVIVEGESVTGVQFGLVHENRDQSQTVTIDWGDPNNTVQWNFSIPPISEIEVGDVFTSSEGIEMTVFQIGAEGSDAVILASLPDRIFQDDPETFTLDESFSGTVTVTDEAGLSSTETFTVEVQNVDPVISDLAVTSEIDEAGTVTVSGTITDPGVLDTFQITIDWDKVGGTEGDAEVFTLGDTAIDTDALTWDPVTRVFAIRHVYEDDNPTATASDDYEIEVSVVDNDHGSFAPHPTREWEGESIAPDTRGRAIAVDNEGIVTASEVDDILHITRHNQEGDVVWTTTLEDADLEIENRLADLVLTADGTSYVATSIGDRFTSDGILIALDAGGNELWRRVFDASTDIIRASVAVDVDGNIFTAFTQRDDGTYSIDGDTIDAETILSKTDSSGNVLWTTAIGDEVLAGELVVDGSGDVFLSSRADVGAVLNGLNNPTSFVTGVVSKLSGDDGSILNHTLLGEGQRAAGIDLNSEGDLVIVGRFENESGNSELRVLELNAGGDLSVVHSFSLSDNESGFNEFALDPQDRLLIAGGYDGTVEIADRSFSGDGEFLLRIEADGSIGWLETFEFRGVDEGIAINENGDFYTTALGESSTWKFVEPENATPSFVETLTLTVNNVDPVISVGADDADEVTLTETGDPNLMGAGTLTLTDVGTLDTHSVDVAASVGITGDAGPLSDADLLAMFSASVNADSSGLLWEFDSGAETFSHVAAGETLELAFTLVTNDDDGGEISQVVTVRIDGIDVNTAPIVTAVAIGETEEGSYLSHTIRITDPDPSNSLTLTIDWGDPRDPSQSVFTLPPQTEIGAGDRFVSPDGVELVINSTSFGINATLESTRIYADDPESFESDVYTRTFTVTDSEGAVGSLSVDVLVESVDPVLEDLTITPAIEEGGLVIVSGTIYDPGLLDTFTLFVNWDDAGNTEGAEQQIDLGTEIIDENGVTWDPGTRSFTIEHRYADDNPSGTSSDIYDVRVSLIDDDHPSLGEGFVPEWNREDPGRFPEKVVSFGDNVYTMTSSFTDVNIQNRSADGELIWTHTYPGNYRNQHELLVGDDGTAYVIENSTNYLRIRQILPDGTLGYEKIDHFFFGTITAGVQSSVMANGDLLFEIGVRGTIEVEGESFSNDGSFNLPILVRLDNSGNLVAATSLYDIGFRDGPRSIASDADGNALVVAALPVSGGLGVNKVSPEGVILSSFPIGLSAGLLYIQTSEDGDIYVSGISIEGDTQEILVSKFDADRNLLASDSVETSVPRSSGLSIFSDLSNDGGLVLAVGRGSGSPIDLNGVSYRNFAALRYDVDLELQTVTPLDRFFRVSDLAATDATTFVVSGTVRIVNNIQTTSYTIPENVPLPLGSVLQTTVLNVAPELSLEDGDSNTGAVFESGDPNLTATGTLTLTDVGEEDSHTASVGSSVTTTGNTGDLTETELRAMLSATVTQDGKVAWVFDSGSETFEYLGEGETLTVDYELSVSDDDTGEDSSTVLITVTGQGVNVGPFLSAAFDAEIYTEGQRPLIEGRYQDSNVTDSHTVVVDWGDGTPSSVFELPRFSSIEEGDTFESVDGSELTIVRLSSGRAFFEIEGRPFPDEAEGDELGRIQPEVIITDSRGLSYSRTLWIQVLDVDPEVEDLTITPILSEGEEAILSGRISDPGVEDTFVLQINWDSESETEGEEQTVELGSTALLDEGGVTWDPVTREFSISHRYIDDDPTSTAEDLYEVSIRLLDQEHPSLSDSYEIEWRSDPGEGSHVEVQTVGEDSYSLLRNSDSRYYLVKRDSAGEVIWEGVTPFSRSTSSFITRAAPVFTTLDSGHSFVIGETGSGTVTFLPVFPDGSIGGSQVIAQAGRDLIGYSISSDDDGNAMILVESLEPITIDGQTFDSTEGSVRFQAVAKVNSEGEFLWSRLLNPPETPEQIFGFVANGSGETFVLYRKLSVEGLFIDDLDVDGNESISFPVESSGFYFDDAELAIAEDGTVIVGFVADHGRELVIKKFSREGTFLEEMNFSSVGPAHVDLTGIGVAEDGTVVVLGDTELPLVEPGGATLEEEFLFEWRPDGEVRTIDPGTSGFRSLAVSDSGDIYVADGPLAKYTLPENFPLPDRSIVTTRVENVSPTITILQQSVSGTGNLTGTARLVEPGGRDELLLLIDWGSAVSRIELPARSDINVGDTFTSPDGTTITITGTGDSTRDFTFEHRFETAGDVTVNFLIEDDDTGFSRTALNLTIPSLGTESTSLADSVVASLAGGGRILEGFRFADSMGFDSSGTFASLSDSEDSAELPLLRVSPVYTGMARPGSVITVRILGGSGELLPGGDLTIVADAGGNWSAVFADLVLGDGPHYIVVEESAPSWASDDMGLGSTTLFFSPTLNHGLAELGGSSESEPRLLAELTESEMAALAGGSGGALEEESIPESEEGSGTAPEAESGEVATDLPEEDGEEASLDDANLFPEVFEEAQP